ncbi:MAG: efflux RND transporter periplasmic adaptor subunit [Gammaproteobacteria bacterium]|nr:efflux RND transporter periplasmic adaptor subunit [Gammaproteobacteria bacterium]
MNKQLTTLIILVTSIFLLTSASVFAAQLQLTKAQLANINLTTATVSNRESLRHLKLNAILTADRRKTHRIAPVVDGIVTTLQVVAHEEVHKGQVLARLRSHSLGQAQAEYLEALARFELADANRTRIEGLWKDGVVAESRWLKVDSEFKSARATLDARRRLLSLTGLSDKQVKRLAKQPNRLAVFDLISPIDGLVTGVDVESGQLLSAGQAAFQVDDLSSLWAMVKIPVASLSQVKTGVEAEIRVQASPGQLYRGELKSLGGEVDAQSQTLTGRIVLANPDGRLRPGMYAEVRLNGVASQGLMVPARAVFRVGDQNYVFKVLGEGRFETVAVKTGVETDGWVPILNGIEVNTTIVSSGVAELKSHWQYQGGE